VNLWTKKCYDGGKYIKCDCPLLKIEGLPMFVRVGGGLAYQKDTMHLTNECPDFLKLELYAEDKAKIILHEGENLTNEFSCCVTGGCVKVYAENNSEIMRRYEICVYCREKSFSISAEVKAGETFRGEIKL